MSGATKIETLLTENLDIWTSAIERRSKAGRGRSKKFSFYGIEKLRSLILDLAIRGKLVPQIEGEGYASQLLKEIAQLRETTNSRKKSTNTRLINLEGIPKGWATCELGSVVEIVRGITFPGTEKSKIQEDGRIACLRTSNVQDEIDWEDILYIKEKFVSRTDQILLPNDIVMSMANSRELVGKVALVGSDIKERTTFGGFLAVIRPYLISPRFLMVYLRNPRTKIEMIDSASQTTNIANISLAKLRPLKVELPPLAEQHRIVAKVDELMALCDALEAGTYDALEAHGLLVKELLATLTSSQNAEDFAQNWARIETHFDNIFTTEDSVDHLKQTILQLAVMGKLVPQNPNDEPASELVKQLRHSRAEAATEQKLRKLKAPSSENKSSKPFDLPSGWQWATFPELGIFDRGKSKHRPRNDPKLFTPGIHPLVQTGEVARADEYIREFHSEYSDVGLAQSRMWPKGTLCITIAANIADTAILDFDACFPDSVVGFVPFEPITSPRYFLHFMKTAKADLLMYAPQTAQKNINVGILDSVQIPLPPLREMTRIVQKVDSLIALCGRMKSCLVQAQNQQIQFADAVASRAVD